MRLSYLALAAVALALLFTATFADEVQKNPAVVPGQGSQPAPAEKPDGVFGHPVIQISADKEEFAEGEPIILTGIIENTGESNCPIAFAPPRGLYIAANPQDWKSREKTGELQTTANYPALMLTHEAYYGIKWDVLKYYEIPPGEYNVKVKYYADVSQKESAFWNGNIESNEIRIVVKPKPAKPGEVPLAERIKKLIADLGNDDWQTREDATAELIKIGTDAIDPLVAASKDSTDPETVWRAQLILKELGYVSDEAVADKVQAILDGIKQNDWTLKETLGLEIVRLGPRVIGTLISYLNNPDYRIRQVVVELLGKIPDKTVVQALINALNDSDTYVRASAAKELRRISGQTYSSAEKDKWQAWWDKNREAFHMPPVKPPEPPKPPQPQPMPED